MPKMMRRSCSVHISLAVAASSALLAVALSLPNPVGAAVTSIGKAGSVFRAGKYVRVTQLAAMTAADLRHATKADNIAGLFDLAVQEGRLDPVAGQQLWGYYNALSQGDLFLLQCLRLKACSPGDAVDVARRSDLHREVMLRNPALNLTQANHAVGEINEQVMRRFFEGSGWSRIEGQVGRAGVDGLFVKVDAGEVRDVLVVEAKYNTGKLAMTNHGTQMSRDWLTQKLRLLRQSHPEDAVYQQIEERIASGYYRSRLWHLRVQNGELIIDLSKVRSMTDEVELIDDVGVRAPRPPGRISIANPDGDRERAIVSSYLNEVERVAGAHPTR
jgi:hypothetical protein